MKLMKSITALTLSALLALTSLSTFAAAPRDLVLQESTAKFSLEVKRIQNSTKDQDFRLTLTNQDTLKLDHLVLGFDYSGDLICNNTGRYLLQSSDFMKGDGTPSHHYTMTFINKWDGQSLGQGSSATYDIKGRSLGGAFFENVVLNSSQKPLKITTVESWQLHGSYQVGSLVHYNGQIYKAIQAHTAHAANWTPNLTPALWVKYKLHMGTAYNVPLK